MHIRISNSLIVSDVPEGISQAVREQLTLVNPKWLENDRMGRWNRNTPKQLRYYRLKNDGGLVLPRGYIRRLIDIAHRQAETFRIDDRRRRLDPVPFSFRGALRPFQATAVAAVAKKDFGTLSAPTGSGKTVMALKLIAQRQQPALVVVHTKELMAQWVERIGTFLGIPSDQVGVIGGGKVRMGDAITVAMVQTLYKCAGETARHVGHLVVDECHRCPSRTFTDAVKAFDAAYMLGLSATPYRRDRLSRLIYWYLGDKQHTIDASELVDAGHILAAEVIVRETEFHSDIDPVNHYSRLLSVLTTDARRNNLIAADIAAEAAADSGVCLVLSDRKPHCMALKAMLWNRFKVDAALLTGDVPPSDRREIVQRLNDGKIRVLVATGQLIGEGFDCKGLSTLFLATPIRFDGRLRQYLGRVLRPAPGKEKARVYDYVDSRVGVLKSSAAARQRIWQDVG